MRRKPFNLIVATMLAAMALPAGAQTIEQRGYRPVDQTIEDVDPLAVSLRRIEPGLLTVGGGTDVFRRIVPGEPSADDSGDGRLYYVNYGVVAEFDQSQYIRLFDRRGRPAGTAQAIPPNTVFHIGLPDNPAVTQAGDSSPAPGQVSGRVDGRFEPVDPPTAVSASYEQLVHAQRAAVIGALGRIR